MNLEPPSHTDVSDLRASLREGTELKYLVLADRFERCAVDIHLLRGGTLDPLASCVLNLLRGAHPLTLERLCELLQITENVEKRIVAEAVHALARADALSFTPHGILPHTAPWEPTKLMTYHEEILFLPPALKARRHVTNKHSRQGTLHPFKLSEYRQAYQDVPVLEHDWSALYTAEGLEDEVRRYYGRNFRADPLRFPDEFNQQQVLQRSHMQIHTDRFVAAAVTSRKQFGYILHRAYLYSASVPGGATHVALVKPYRGNSIEWQYTARLQRTFKSSPDIFKAFWETSKLLP